MATHPEMKTIQSTVQSDVPNGGKVIVASLIEIDTLDIAAEPHQGSAWISGENLDSRRQTIWRAGKKERPVVSGSRDAATAADYTRRLWVNAN
jgi:hypothetical protein